MAKATKPREKTKVSEKKVKSDQTARKFVDDYKV